MPGPPSNSRPRRGRPPISRAKLRCDRNSCSERTTSSLTTSMPTTSASRTSICSGRITTCGERPVKTNWPTEDHRPGSKKNSDGMSSSGSIFGTLNRSTGLPETMRYQRNAVGHADQNDDAGQTLPAQLLAAASDIGAARRLGQIEEPGPRLGRAACRPCPLQLCVAFPGDARPRGGRCTVTRRSIKPVGQRADHLPGEPASDGSLAPLRTMEPAADRVHPDASVASPVRSTPREPCSRSVSGRSVWPSQVRRTGRSPGRRRHARCLAGPAPAGSTRCPRPGCPGCSTARRTGRRR